MREAQVETVLVSLLAFLAARVFGYRTLFPKRGRGRRRSATRLSAAPLQSVARIAAGPAIARERVSGRAVFSRCRPS